VKKFLFVLVLLTLFGCQLEDSQTDNVQSETQQIKNYVAEDLQTNELIQKGSSQADELSFVDFENEATNIQPIYNYYTTQSGTTVLESQYDDAIYDKDCPWWEICPGKTKDDSKFQMTFTLERDPYVGGDYSLYLLVENFKRHITGSSWDLNPEDWSIKNIIYTIDIGDGHTISSTTHPNWGMALVDYLGSGGTCSIHYTNGNCEIYSNNATSKMKFRIANFDSLVSGFTPKIKRLYAKGSNKKTEKHNKYAIINYTYTPPPPPPPFFGYIDGPMEITDCGSGTWQIVVQSGSIPTNATFKWWVQYEMSEQCDYERTEWELKSTLSYLTMTPDFPPLPCSANMMIMCEVLVSGIVVNTLEFDGCGIICPY
jgi:hypothetical protein